MVKNCSSIGLNERHVIYYSQLSKLLCAKNMHQNIYIRLMVINSYKNKTNKAVLELRVSPDFAITYFCNHCNIRFENTDQSMWIHWPFFPKTWTKGHWPLDDLWPHVCWGHMCDSTQGSLCPSPMTIHQCMWIQWSILQNTTYIYIHTHTTYRMSDHIVSYWTQFRGDKKEKKLTPKNIFIQNNEPIRSMVQKDLWP